MTPSERTRFDRLLDDVVEALPRAIHDLMDEVPVIVEDAPSPALAAELGLEADEVICGLHTGTMITERSVIDPPDLPETIHLFREGIVEEAGGREAHDDEIREQIRITLLHEIGHHFGLDEDALEELGYD